MPGQDEVSESGVVAKVRREMETEGREKEVLEGIRKILKGQEGFKSFCEKFPELCEGQQRLERKVDGIERKASEPRHLFLAGKETKHTNLPDLLSCCDSDDPKSCPTPGLCADIPPTLQAKMLRHFCKNAACIEELQKQGFELDGQGYREKYKGFLGG